MIRKILNHCLAFALFALAMPTAVQAQFSGGGSGTNEPPSNATLQRECDDGSFSSCGVLGQRYQDDYNASPADMKKGFALFKRACEGGDTISCGDLAQSYLFGKGVAVDERRAAQLSERICKDGNMIGCSLLGIIHQEGRAGYPKNPTTALSYYRKACNESQPRWEFPCKRADALASVAPQPTDRGVNTAVVNGPVATTGQAQTSGGRSAQGTPRARELKPILDRNCRVFPELNSRFNVYGIGCDDSHRKASAPSHNYADANISAFSADAKTVSALGLRFSIPSNWSQRPSQVNEAIFGGPSTSFAEASTQCSVGIAKPELLELVRQTINSPHTSSLAFVQQLEGSNVERVFPAHLIVGNVHRGELIGLDYFSDTKNSYINHYNSVFVRDFGLPGANVVLIHCRSGGVPQSKNREAGALIASTLVF